jgi:DNA-binding Lrp family transcriptional regulator
VGEVDATDVRIFCEMAFKYANYTAFTERHASPTEISKKLGLGEKTVRLRVRKMEEEGFIKYYQAIPNLALFGLKSATMYAFEADDVPSKSEKINYLRGAPWVLEITDLLGPIFTATLAGASNEAVQTIADGITSKLSLKRQLKLLDHNAVDPPLSPTKLDWQIIQKLRYDALCSSKEISKALSITYRMAEYRITRLLESRAFFIKALIDARKQKGLIFYILTFYVDPAKQLVLSTNLRKMFGEKLWLILTPKEGVIVGNLFAYTAGEPEEALIESLKLEGAKQGSLVILKEWIECERPNWIDNLIEEKISI